MHIKSVTLRHFQGHKDTSFDMSKGLNAITGPTGSGKSAVTKAVEWVYNNTVAGEKRYGNAIHSHWITKLQEKTGNITITGTTTVSITFSNGITVTRNKGKVNNYIISYPDKEDLVLEKFSQDVPQEVKDIFNFKDMNFQNQWESKYLIFETPGEIARRINSIVDLELYEKILKEIKSQTTAVRSKVKFVQESIDEKKEELKEYNNLTEMKADLDVLKDKQKDLDSINNSLSVLSNSIVKIEDIDKQIELYKGLDDQEGILTQLLAKEALMAILIEENSKLEGIISDTIYLDNELSKYDKLDEQESDLLLLLDKLNKINESEVLTIKRLHDNIVSVSKELSEYKDDGKEEVLLGLLEKYNLNNELQKEVNAIQNIITNILKCVNDVKILDKSITEIEELVHEELATVGCPLCGHVGG